MLGKIIGSDLPISKLCVCRTLVAGASIKLDSQESETIESKRYPLVIGDFLFALITYAHFKLVAHDGYTAPSLAALGADRSTALPTMVLKK